MTATKSKDGKLRFDVLARQRVRRLFPELFPAGGGEEPT